MGHGPVAQFVTRAGGWAVSQLLSRLLNWAGGWAVGRLPWLIGPASGPRTGCFVGCPSS